MGGSPEDGPKEVRTRKTKVRKSLSQGMIVQEERDEKAK